MIRTRFAPSPTGYLHIGGLRTALYAYLFAKKAGGKFILRIEDTDLERYVEGATELIYSSLKDAGLAYDEGPDVGGDFGPYVQSLRREIYTRHASDLIERGGAYRCFCTRERLEQLRSGGEVRKYDKHCLSLSAGEIESNLSSGVPYVIRQNMPLEGTGSYTDLVYGEISVDYKELEDNVLIKSDGMPTYNFANVVDDHLMKITHVIRGSEYLSSTPKYNLLYDAFGWERPQYIHLPPVMRDAQHKLSKRYGDPSFNDLVAEGFLKESLINYIALLGWSPKNNLEKMDFDTLMQLFSLEGLSKSPAIFDKAKLTWMNGEYIKQMDAATFLGYALPWIDGCPAAAGYDRSKLAALLHTRTELFSQIPQLLEFLGGFEGYDLNLLVKPKMKTTLELASQVLPEVLTRLEALAEFTQEAVHGALMQTVADMGLKNGQVLWTFRVAVTGAESTPGGAMEMADLLGRELTLSRLKTTIERLKSV